ncbi:leucyl/phenylalanyl-tRNA--protein transferase [Psychrobium sp. 1_MG-2023]|uniref:leucyl/phenylalanyl-tRNA--protein transferase n=1 Tax=Psychrobium sp. 1_MG-2023 TaxID=3062624 RepID=UPI000C32F456|nr:leucyl/phenylalanyl-tRNA--protein transferase [Psychrobium sp. 1_MG-2023]MDP2561872.1 leucyl/phenylalanyl-tRNA--protein transferase [Psychrobium sp. 1_MG-2023]PKF59713.1 leucyl/phenylalanyl-tRNA--protein transferase [Alteromonadales bacterium alter-6D02]
MSQLIMLDDNNTIFPPANLALSEPNGLLAIGGDLTTERLISAYKQGIFPWYNDDDPILWWSPDPRCVFFTDQFYTSKSFKKFLKKSPFKITLNQQFKQVIAHCTLPREKQDGTWINTNMMQAYNQLHQEGVAHSIEVWHNETLVGGLYGLFINNVFCGESMFSLEANASKQALYTLCQFLSAHGVKMIDSQVENDHLLSLGAQSIPRVDFLNHLKSSSTSNISIDWSSRELCHD